MNKKRSYAWQYGRCMNWLWYFFIFINKHTHQYIPFMDKPQEIIVGGNQLEVSRQIGMMGAYELLENWPKKTQQAQADACHGRVEDIWQSEVEATVPCKKVHQIQLLISNLMVLDGHQPTSRNLYALALSHIYVYIICVYYMCIDTFIHILWLSMYDHGGHVRNVFHINPRTSGKEHLTKLLIVKGGLQLCLKDTPLKTNGWNLKIPHWKRRNIDPNHQFLGSMFVLGGVSEIYQV